MKNFGLIGTSGYIAPRHLRAIRDTGNQLVAAVDPHDSVGILDQFFPQARFFTEIERFDRHIEKQRLTRSDRALDYLAICSPNYLHDAHARLGLRIGADVICEKPLVINPWNLDQLSMIEREHNCQVYNILQLRVHPKLIELRERFQRESGDRMNDVEISYVTPRGNWYRTSWKGDIAKSGGVITNIGIHLFDLMMWFFGREEAVQLHQLTESKAAGTVRMKNANLRWFLSIDAEDHPNGPEREGNPAHRSITINGEELEFSGGFFDLHTESYRQILAGLGFGIEEARPSIELVHKLRNLPVSEPDADAHPFVRRSLDNDCTRRRPQIEPTTGFAMADNSFFVHESSFVDEPVEIGEGTKFWHFCHVMKGAKIGRNCIFGQNVNIDGDTVIGDNVKVQNNVSIYSGLVIEDNVFLGPSCVLTNVTNPRSEIVRHGLYERTILRRGCSIGANATIVCGIEVGRYAFIGSGAVVTKHVPDYAMIVGVPGKKVGWASRHGLPLPKPNEEGIMVCPESGLRYREVDPGVVRCLDIDEEEPLPEEMREGSQYYDEIVHGRRLT